MVSAMNRRRIRVAARLIGTAADMLPGLLMAFTGSALIAFGLHPQLMAAL